MNAKAESKEKVCVSGGRRHGQTIRYKLAIFIKLVYILNKKSKLNKFIKSFNYIICSKYYFDNTM